MGCMAEKGVMNQLPKSILMGFRRRATIPWLQMRVLRPIHRIRFRSIQALDVPFLILTGDWGVYSTYALIRKNEYYMRRNLIQVYYGTSLGGIQRYTNNPSRNQCDLSNRETIGKNSLSVRRAPSRDSVAPPPPTPFSFIS